MTRSIPVILSLHDVMPNSMAPTQRWVSRCLELTSPENLVLLVVPGLDWPAQALRQLLQWQQAGVELAGHGWRHRVWRLTTPYHRWHSRFISRQAAEHLSLSKVELMELVRCNHQWFIHHDFQAPELYVPPAWAMGRLNLEALQRLPFRYYESISGFWDGQTRRRRRLPLAGFEADRRWRAFGLRLWNRFNRGIATQQRPLRLSIHPFDDEYYLAPVLERWLQYDVAPMSYRSLFNTPSWTEPMPMPGNGRLGHQAKPTDWQNHGN